MAIISGQCGVAFERRDKTPSAEYPPPTMGDDSRPLGAEDFLIILLHKGFDYLGRHPVNVFCAVALLGLCTMGHISCLCGEAAQSVHLSQSPEASLLTLCHCSSCRSTSGELCASYLALLSPPTSFEKLVQYAQSRNVDRWFCRKCGSHVFIRRLGDFFVASGSLDAAQLETRAVEHSCVADTLDAGVSRFISKVASRTATYRGGDSSASQHRSQAEVISHKEPCNQQPKEQRLPARCHCGGVEYFITPPDASSKAASSPWPDLLVPHHSGSSHNPDDVKWWLRAGDTKFLAGFCACNSCRLASGFPIQSWAFVSKSNIFKADGSSLSYDMSTLQAYESSPEVYREFCNRCGATVFWHCDERPAVVDVSVGLLKARSGAMALSWLDWETQRVSFTEDAVDSNLIKWLEDGLLEWKGVGLLQSL